MHWRPITRAAGLGAVAAVAALALTAPAAAATNLLANPSFDDLVNGWTGGMTWDSSVDHTNTAGSGSALFVDGTVLPPGAGSSFVTMSQCLTGVVPGTGYDFGIWVLIRSGQTSNADSTLLLQFFSDATCTNNIANNGGNPDPGNPQDAGVWTLTQGHATAPPGTQSARFMFESRKLDSEPFELHADDAFLAPVPVAAVAVPALGLTGALVLVAGLALAGSLLARRSRSRGAPGQPS